MSLQGYRVTGLQGYKVAGLQGCKVAGWAVQNGGIFSFHFLELYQFNFHLKFCFFGANLYLGKSKRWQFLNG